MQPARSELTAKQDFDTTSEQGEQEPKGHEIPAIQFPAKQDFDTTSQQEEEDTKGSEINETLATERFLPVRVPSPKTTTRKKRLRTSRSENEDFVTSEQGEEEPKGHEIPVIQPTKCAIVPDVPCWTISGQRIKVQPTRPAKQDFDTTSEQKEEDTKGSEISETLDTECFFPVKVSSPKTAIHKKKLRTSRSAPGDFVATSQQAKDLQTSEKNHPQSFSENLKQKDLGDSSGAANAREKKTVTEEAEAQQDVVATSEQEEEKLEGSENNQPQVGKERKKHKTDETEVYKHLCDSASGDSNCDELVQQRKAGKPDHLQFARKDSAEWDCYRPAKGTFKKQNKMRNQTHSSDDHDDLTCSSEVASEQLGRDREAPLRLFRIQNAVLSCERLAESTDHCEKLTEKAKKMETEVSILQKELSETKRIKSELERQKFEWERELSCLRFALKQVEEKRRHDHIVYEEIREKLRRKKEQYRKEFEVKQQLKHTLRTQDVELMALRKKWNEINQSLISPSGDKETDLLRNEIARLREEINTIKMQNKEKEKKYLEDNKILQENNNDLQRTIKLNEEKFTRTVSLYGGEITVLTHENIILNYKLEEEKQNKERLKTEVESYQLRLAASTQDHDQSQAATKDLGLVFQQAKDELSCRQEYVNSHASILFQQLCESERKLRNLQAEFCHTRDALQERTLVLEGVQRDLRETQFQRKEMEQKFQREQDKVSKYIIKQESLEERLSEEQCKNMLLQQQLDDAHKEVANKDKAITINQDKFYATVKTLGTESKMQSLLLEEKNQKLMHECNHLKERVYQHEKEKEREAVERQLRQELAGIVHELSSTETSLGIKSRCQAHLEDETQDSKQQLSQIRSQLQEVHSQLEETGRFVKKLQDHRKNFQIENSSTNEAVDNVEQYKKQLLSASSTRAPSQMELNVTHRESDISTLETSQDDFDETTFRRYDQLYLKDFKHRKSLSSKLSEADQTLAEVGTELLEEKSKSS
nr:ankyrin repeat domain-containing protein 26-like isoform X3 [Microcebus murinus]